jgi:hypothetical protein
MVVRVWTCLPGEACSAILRAEEIHSRDVDRLRVGGINSDYVVEDSGERWRRAQRPGGARVSGAEQLESGGPAKPGIDDFGTIAAQRQRDLGNIAGRQVRIHARPVAVANVPGLEGSITRSVDCPPLLDNR